MNMQCPCGSGNLYNECCEPVIIGSRIALTPEVLMRSRYSAYALNEIDYIFNSTHPDYRGDMDKEATQKWASESEWIGLKIINTQNGGSEDSEGTVEFTAEFINKGIKQEHHELGTFKKADDKWYFAEGQYIAPRPFVRIGDKVGRNDPCTCGSGKKYKKCCGKEA